MSKTLRAIDNSMAAVFNDDPRTRHVDVLAVIDATLADMETELARG